MQYIPQSAEKGERTEPPDESGPGCRVFALPRAPSPAPVLELNLAMDDNELKYWIAFTQIPHIGPVRFKLMERHFGSLEEAWRAGIPELKLAGLDARAARSVAEGRQTIDPDAEISRLADHHARAIAWRDADYPPRLKEIADSPPVLYCLGEILAEDERSVAVVGTRRATAYGRQVAHRLSFDMAKAGVTIVSGLASGIDAVAHWAALEAGNRTVAVLGSGVDVMYPREHTNLAAQIAENGALISEHPLGTRPKAEHFPRRNRILSGITLGTLVVEAGEHSGALITARHALDQNREVFAVPGSVLSPSSRGTNRLIQRSEAKLVSDYKDILEELNLSWVGKQIEMEALFPANDNESQVLHYVGHEPIHIDEIIRSSGLEISIVSSVLAMMELRGMVRQVGGMNYVRV